jgi:hypothetical protein
LEREGGDGRREGKEKGAALTAYRAVQREEGTSNDIIYAA